MADNTTTIDGLTPEEMQAYGVEVLPTQPQAGASGLGLTPEEMQAYGVEILPSQAQQAAASEAPRPIQGFGEAVRLGIKEQLSPFTMTAEEYKRPADDASEIAGKILGNIGAGLGTGVVGAQVGAAIGTALLPGLGTAAGALGGATAATLLGIYSGLGKEYIRSKAEGKPFDPLRGTIAVATEVNPLIKGGSKVINALRVAGQVAGEAGWEYSHSKDPLATSIAAGLGVLTSPLLFKGMTTSGQTPTPTSVVDINKKANEIFNSDKGFDLLNKIETRIKKEGIPELPPKFDTDFKRWVIGNADGADSRWVTLEFARKTKNWSADQFKDAWQTKNYQDVMRDEAAKLRQSMSHEIAEHGVHDSTSATGRWLKDAKFVARDTDIVTGLNTEGMLDAFSEARAKHNIATTALMAAPEKLAKQAKRIRLSPEDIGYALSGKDDKVSNAGKAILSTPAGKQVLAGWNKAFDDAYKYIKGQGYNIGYIDNKYIPMYAQRGAELATSLDTAKSKLERMMAQEGVDDITKLATPASKELVEDLQTVSKFITGAEIKSPQEIDSLIRHAWDTQKTRSGYELSAMMSRRGELPDFIRNFNINDLYLQYINGNLKAVHFDKAFDMMDANIGALDGLGMKETAKYFDRLSRDIAGADSGWVANLNRKIEQMQYVADKVLRDKENPSQWEKTYAKALKGVPEFVATLTNLVYPSYLGANVKAAIRNFTQPLMTTAPELGHQYGLDLVSRAMYNTGVDRVKRGINLENFLQSKNLLGPRFTGEALSSDASFAATRAKEMLGKYNDITMALYGLSDGVNRYVTYKAGNLWAKDIASGKSSAIKALDRLSTGVKAEIRKRGIDVTKDTDQLGDVLGRYLIGKTQFNYGKDQLNQLGREYGRLVSMFTKWPVMVGSDIVELFNKQGVKGSGIAFEKYLLPLITLSLMGKYVLDVDKTPALKYALGEPAQYAPLSSIQGVLQGSLGSPVVRLGANTLGGFYDLAAHPTEGKKIGTTLKKGVREIATTFTPIAAPVINELDRWQQAHGKKKVSDLLLEEIGFPVNKSRKP